MTTPFAAPHMSLHGTKLTFDSRGGGTSATEGAWQNRGSPPRSKHETRSRQLVEQRLGVLQDRRVEAFGEPAVDSCDKITGVGALALIAP